VTGVEDGLMPAQSSDTQMKQTNRRGRERAGLGRSSRRASMSTKPDGDQSKCDRVQAERSRLGRSRANHWPPLR